MHEDNTSPVTDNASNAPKPVSRPARIVAVTATTALLMTTTAVGIIAVTHTLQPQGTAVTSAEAATSMPVRITPVLASAASLPDLSTTPALPSIKKIIKSIKANDGASVSGSTGAAQESATTPSAPSTRDSDDRAKGTHVVRERAEHESGD